MGRYFYDTLKHIHTVSLYYQAQNEKADIDVVITLTEKKYFSIGLYVFIGEHKKVTYSFGGTSFDELKQNFIEWLEVA